MGDKYPIKVEPNMKLPIEVEDIEWDLCDYIQGGIVVPCNPLYDEARLGYNLACAKCPGQIVYCYSKEDIISVLRYSQKYNMPFRIRTGRHDYECNSSLNKGIIIDISPMNSIVIDYESQTVSVGGGVTIEKMYEVLENKGYIIGAPVEGSIGLGSVTSVGGIGLSSRYLGLTCDQLVEVELIDAKGEVLSINEAQYQDLFWALRGGLGSNFGVIVGMKYRLTRTKQVTYFSVFYEMNVVEEVIDRWQQETPCADWRLSSVLRLERGVDGVYLLNVQGIFWGRKRECMEVIEPLIRCIPSICEQIEYVGYREAMDRMERQSIGKCAFKGTGSFTYHYWNIEQIRILVSLFREVPKTYYASLHLVSLQGKIGEVASTATAYVHREALFLTEIKGIWGESCMDEEVVVWVNKVKLLLDTMGRGTYRGFTDFTLMNWQQQYYGENYQRLQEIKKKYDPENIFRFRQSIEWDEEGVDNL